MSLFVFDLEADSLTPTKIWCVGCQDVDKEVVNTTTSYENMRKLFGNESHVFICHNGMRFDKPVLERILGITIKAKVVDTLFIAWYLEPNRNIYGLDSYGEEAGIPKPKITDWENLSIEEYLHRVTEDVKINMYVWKKQWANLLRLYGSEEGAWRLIDFLMLHASFAADQEKFGWKLDVGKCSEGLAMLRKDQEDKFNELQKHMPQVPVYVKRNIPKRDMYKISGDMSADWVKWYALLDEHSLPHTFAKELKVVASYKPPNAGSVTQLKDWCYSLGWKPSTFEYKRDKKTGDLRKIPQLRVKDGDGVPSLAPAVAKLLVKEPKLGLIADLGVITHRIGVLNGFMKDVDEDGYISAQMQGFTNTLRWRHRVVLNLPGVDKMYGELMRGCLIAPDGYELCGSDMAALEDRTKQHYMWPHDPDYVTSMLEEGYCPHVDIAVLAGFLTKEQEDRHKTGQFLDKADKGKIKAGRKKAKPVNYGGVYGQQPEGLARETGMPLAQAKQLFKIYWERNWSVEAIADEQITKKCLGIEWLYNPVSKLWYELRTKRDRFSTLNQGTGAYCFTLWMKNIRDLGGPPIIGSMHDEVICLIKKVDGAREACEALIHKAIGMVNEELVLNRELEVDVQFNHAYSGIH